MIRDWFERCGNFGAKITDGGFSNPAADLKNGDNEAKHNESTRHVENRGFPVVGRSFGDELPSKESELPKLLQFWAEIPHSPHNIYAKG